MTRATLNTYRTIYRCTVLVRIILVFVPQTGYIHPDELFQSVEVLAGKFLDVECSPPWEFNSSFPIRSMTIPYFTIGMSYKFLNGVNNLLREYYTITILDPYTLLVAPRLLICIFSFVVDFALYKICSNNNEKYKSRLIVLGSSYVMLVYGTRTFSNTIELILFSILLYLVCESLTFSNILIRKKEYINFRYEQSTSVVERAKFHKLRLFMAKDSFRNCFPISVVTVLGFFNRPTFLAFAVIPIFFWLYRGIGTKSVILLQFHLRIIALLLCSIPGILICVLVDSFYYGYITWGEIGMLDVSINNFVFTPLNFLKYNINTENLRIHGLHPRFLHVLVNIPLLFNILGGYAVLSLVRYVYMCCVRQMHVLPSVRSIKCLMTLSFVTPIALLSVFPHQEPRFLIPVVMPLAYLHGMSILPEPDKILVEASKIHSNKERKCKQHTYFALKIWLTLNALLTVFYGFIHQGGVLKATSYISQDLTVTPLTTEFHIVTSHVYSLPESFFLQKPSNKLYKKGNVQYYVSQRVFLYEEGSTDLSSILNKLQSIIALDGARKSHSTSKQIKVYLLISSSLEDHLNYLVKKRPLNLYLVETFYPHLSLEAFPDFTRYCLDITSNFHMGNCSILTYNQYFWKLVRSVSLSLYEVALNDI